MSENERHQALGRSVEDYGAAKRELALAEQRAVRIGDSLSAAGRALIDPELSDRSALVDLPAKADVLALFDDILNLRHRKANLARTLEQAGVPLKD